MEYFSVQMSDHNTFGKIPVDQAIEETVNKDTQTPDMVPKALAWNLQL